MKLKFLIREISYKPAFKYQYYKSYILRNDNDFEKGIFTYSARHRPNTGHHKNGLPAHIYVPYRLRKL